MDEVSYTRTADYPGVFMYHCGTGPVLQHISTHSFAYTGPGAVGVIEAAWRGRLVSRSAGQPVSSALSGEGSRCALRQ